MEIWRSGANVKVALAVVQHNQFSNCYLLWRLDPELLLRISTFSQLLLNGSHDEVPLGLEIQQTF